MASAVATTTCANVPQYSETRVGFVFDMTVQPCFTANVPPRSYILVQLPTYDIGFVRFENTITCQIDSRDVYCIPQQGSDYVLVVSPSTQLIVSARPRITIKNLQWPRYSEDLSGRVLAVKVMDPNTRTLLQDIAHNALANGVPARFDDIVSVVPKKGSGFVDATYEFTFYPQATLPAGAVVVLEFPSIYNLLAGAYPPYFEQSGLEPLNGGAVTITVNLLLIKVSNFAEHAAGEPFTLTAHGIKNSAEAITSAGWRISVLYADRLVLAQDNFFSFDFSTPFRPGHIVFN